MIQVNVLYPKFKVNKYIAMYFIAIFKKENIGLIMVGMEY
jgi:hypothetical protein